MNPAALRIKLPEDIDPVGVLINDQTRFFHSMKQFFPIACPDLKDQETITLIALAAGAVVNQRVLYHFFLDRMPDEKAKALLENLLGNMDILVDSTFGRSLEEMQDLTQQRKKYCDVIEDILKSYSRLTDYLKSKNGKQ